MHAKGRLEKTHRFYYLTNMQRNCLNCGSALSPSQRYCSDCGQQTGIKRISAITLIHDFFRSLFDIDKGILHLIKGLATAPGTVAINYVEGKRKRYFNPFGFLAICVAFSVIVSNWVAPYESLPKVNDIDVMDMPTKELRKLSLTANERATAVQNFVNQNMNIITVLIIPYVAFMLWLFFRKAKRNLSEIILAYILFTGFGTIISTFFLYLPMIFLRSHLAFIILIWSSLLLQTLYYTWGMTTFFGYRTSKGFIKVLSVFLLTGFVGMVFTFIALFFYVYGGNWDLLYYVSQQKRI